MSTEPNQEDGNPQDAGGEEAGAATETKTGTDAPTDQPAAQQATGIAQQAEGPALMVNAQYVKDLSFEAPNAPEVLSELQRQQPDIKIDIDVRAERKQEAVFEVVIHVTAKCKAGETPAFMLELAYGGLFTVRVPDEHLQPVVLIECPRLLFPFARNIVADTTRDGGFPPLMMAPVDFVAMYQARAQQAAQQAASASPTQST